MRVPLFLFFVLFATFLFGQAPVDSLAVVKQVDSLTLVFREHMSNQELDQAFKVILSAESLALNNLGQESAAYGSCCHIRAFWNYFKNDFAEAEKWYLKAIDIREKALGKGDLAYIKSLSNLAILYIEMGQYEKAEPLCLEVKVMVEKAQGKENPFYTNSLNALATVYLNLGQNEKVEALYLEAKTIEENVLGKKDLGYTNILNNLAIWYQDMGQNEKAEPLFLESKAIREKIAGKENTGYAGALYSLADLYSATGEFDKSEALYLEAKAIEEKILGKEHPYYAQSLHGLATLYMAKGEYAKAEQLYLEAKAIGEKVLGKEHPSYAIILHNLANLYRNIGQYAKAEQLYLEAKSIREKVLGKEHPLYASSICNLALLYRDMGQYEKAEPLFMELSTTQKSLIQKSLRHLSEQELNDYLNTFYRRQNQTLAFTQVANNKKLIPICYDNCLFYKGFLLQAAGEIKRLALSDEGSTEKFNQIKSYERQLAALYTRSFAERDTALIIRLETLTNEIEKDLNGTIAGYSETKRQVRWQEVQATLQPGEVAVEFVHYDCYQKKEKEEEKDSTMYAALVLHSGISIPAFIPLFEEHSLNTLLFRYDKLKSDYVNFLYTTTGKDIQPLGHQQKSLYELIWQPIEKELSGTKTVFFSPSGLLHRLNLNAIPINDKETLSDRYHLVEMGSTRQLVISPESNRSTPDAGQALLFGGVQYDLNSDSIASQNIDIESSITGTRGELNFSFTDSTDRGGSWNYLKWTDKEVTALEPILRSAHIQTTIRKGYAATEEAFKSIGSNGKSPRILHIATHGYFFPDPVGMRNTEFRMRNDAEPVFKMSEHPMIRSGLILAGGNHAWKTGKPFKEGMEDGILTAYEISQMDLSNTELVVLSACETGLGDIQGNEGVYGLQRAFKIAGAKYLIMSLWQVPDFQTQELMTAFYTNWLTKQMSIPDAFRAAQQAMREKYEHPYFWAGFVLVE